MFILQIQIAQKTVTMSILSQGIGPHTENPGHPGLKQGKKQDIDRETEQEKWLVRKTRIICWHSHSVSKQGGDLGWVVHLGGEGRKYIFNVFMQYKHTLTQNFYRLFLSPSKWGISFLNVLCIYSSGRHALQDRMILEIKTSAWSLDFIFTSLGLIWFSLSFLFSRD